MRQCCRVFLTCPHLLSVLADSCGWCIVMSLWFLADVLSFERNTPSVNAAMWSLFVPDLLTYAPRAFTRDRPAALFAYDKGLPWLFPPSFTISCALFPSSAGRPNLGEQQPDLEAGEHMRYQRNSLLSRQVITCATTCIRRLPSWQCHVARAPLAFVH